MNKITLGMHRHEYEIRSVSVAVLTFFRTEGAIDSHDCHCTYWRTSEVMATVADISGDGASQAATYLWEMAAGVVGQTQNPPEPSRRLSDMMTP